MTLKIDITKTFNEVVLIGFVAEIPKLYQFDKLRFATFKVITSLIKNVPHSDNKKFTYHPVTAYHHNADIVMNSGLTKGNHVLVRGQINWYKRLGKTDISQYTYFQKYTIIANYILLLDRTYKHSIDKFITEVLETEKSGIPF